MERKQQKAKPTKAVPADAQMLLDATHHDPFSYLGQHKSGRSSVQRVFYPYAKAVSIDVDGEWVAMKQLAETGLFEHKANKQIKAPYRLLVDGPSKPYETYDTYSFASSVTDDDLHLFGEGQLKQAYQTFGAHLMQVQGVQGVRFVVWAPNAQRVSVVGSFNQWDGRIHSMRALGSSGVWEIFIPHLTDADIYKFEIRNRHTGQILVKTDPYGLAYEPRPGSAAKVTQSSFEWSDATWLESRRTKDWLHAPFNCYEVHLGSWQRDDDGHYLTYRQLAESLVPHVAEMGYTHVELLPVTEHPLNESWGYQTTGYFAATNRFGSPDDLRYLINAFHQANIGVILDWVPGHFPKDDWALARFDGTALYEHEDPRLGEHQDWGTYIFNYGRNEVQSFLLSNAHFWIDQYHIDGLRVDAVASMLYLDYSRKEGEWLPNKYGGRENLEAIEFLKQLNMMVGESFPGALTIAEESTAWPAVSRPVYTGGLGFNMKWNMGWMNDTLTYIEEDPVHRKYHHDKLTFGQLYAYSENFILPFSHDEVVHGKRSLLDKMPGDAWQKFANLRLLAAYQMTTPGKKLNFMGNEFGQGKEWSVNTSLDWHLLGIENPGASWHAGIQLTHRDLNQLYLNTLALHDQDFDVQGFDWIDCHDSEQSVISYVRRARDGQFVIVVLNFTPVTRDGYRLGVPSAGHYIEKFNSDASCYGGSNQGNGAGITAEPIAWMNQSHSIEITLPPLSGIVLALQ